MVTSNKIKGKLLTLKRLKNMATENGWSLTTTPSVFETKLLKVSEVKQVTPYYTGANNSSGLYIKSFYSNEGLVYDYKDNQLVLDSDIDYQVVQQKTISTITYTASNMDAMGGLHIEANVTYTDGSSETITDQTKFTVTDTSTSNTNLSGSYTIDSTAKVVIANENNPEQYTKTRLLEIKLTDSTISEPKTVTQQAETYGYYTVADSTNPVLDDANWNTISTAYHDYTGWLDDFGSGMLNAKKDWYITTAMDTALSAGTDIPTSDPVRAANDNLNGNTYWGKDKRANQSRNYHISWISDKASEYWIFDIDTFYITMSNCAGKIIESDGGTIGVNPTYELDYKKPQHCYGKMSIKYAEAYPDTFRNDIAKGKGGSTTMTTGYPWHILYHNPTTSEYLTWSQIQSDSLSQYSEITTAAETLPTTLPSDTVLNPKANGATCHNGSLNIPTGDSSQEYNYTVTYSFLCPEICIKDTSTGVISRDTSDASNITSYEEGENASYAKTYKYNTIDSDSYAKAIDNGVLLYGIDTVHNPQTLECDLDWDKNNDTLYIYTPEESSSEANVDWAITNKTYANSSTLPTNVTYSKSTGYIFTDSAGTTTTVYRHSYGGFYYPYQNTATFEYGCDKETTITAIDSNGKERYMEVYGTLSKGPVTVAAGTDHTVIIHSGYSVAPVTIIVSQSIDGQTLTANITGNTTGGTYADNKITWDNLTAMNFSGYAYDSTRTDNFE